MKGLKFTYIQTYTYENKEELIQFLRYNQFESYQIQDEYKIIEYKIPSESNIKLSELIEFIKIGYIRIHFAQLLNLIKTLLEKDNQLKQQNINHKFIDLNRIWISLIPGSLQFNFIYSNPNYEIKMVGFQCPFYEKSNEFNNKIEQISIFNIINQIINNVKDNIKTEDKQLKQQMIDNLIIINKQQNSQQFIQWIAQMYAQYNYNAKEQRLSFDRTQHSSVGTRGRKKEDVDKYFKKLQDQIKGYQHFVNQQIMKQCTLQLAKQVENQLYNDPQLNIDQLKNEIIQQQLKIEQECKKYCKEIFKDKFTTQIKRISTVFDLKLTDQEIQKYLDEEPNKFYSKINYIFNNVEFIQNDELYSNFQAKLTTEICNYCDLFIQELFEFKLLALIADLI